MKEVTEMRERALERRDRPSRIKGWSASADAAQALLEAEADLDIALDIINRLQQVKIPPLLFGEQLLATAFSLRDSLKDVDENVVEDSPKMWTRVTDALEGSEWLEEYRR